MTEKRTSLAEEPKEKPIDKLVLSVDTSDFATAERLVGGFKDAGGSIVKLGLELLTAKGSGGLEGLSELARQDDINWVFDGKIKDIGNTMKGAIKNIVSYDHPPMAITMHSDTSLEGMKAAQEAAGTIPMLGVTLLTDIGPSEAVSDYGNDEEKRDVDLRIAQARRSVDSRQYASDAERVDAQQELTEEIKRIIEKAGARIRIRTVLERGRKLGGAGVQGLVASPLELDALMKDPLTKNRLKLIPGTRSAGIDANDQMNTMTPEDAIAKGADLLVIGRQYTTAKNRADMLAQLEDEVARGLDRRGAN